MVRSSELSVGCSPPVLGTGAVRVVSGGRGRWRIGVSPNTGQKWFRDAGGVMPRAVKPARVRPRLTFEQREDIAIWHAAKVTNAEIARRIGCHRSTVGRELASHSTTFNDGHRPRYRASVAQSRAEWAARRPKQTKLATCARLRDQVQDGWTRSTAPSRSLPRLRVDFPDDAEMRVSHETIYQALYVQGRGALRRELTSACGPAERCARPRRTPGQRRGRIADMVNISERPAEVEDRAVPGHWEGDLIPAPTNSPRSAPWSNAPPGS